MSNNHLALLIPFRQDLANKRRIGYKKLQQLTAPKFNLGIRLRHLQKLSLPRKKFIFALQMSNKHLALLGNISVENGSKAQTKI
ncbi:MAG: hypothetical protein C0448_07810 [Sphingobacteriaceae bacterium]|nr:hypothetical protein [Sphingobacteriaceae bacterium]